MILDEIFSLLITCELISRIKGSIHTSKESWDGSGHHFSWCAEPLSIQRTISHRIDGLGGLSLSSSRSGSIEEVIVHISIHDGTGRCNREPMCVRYFREARGPTARYCLNEVDGRLSGWMGHQSSPQAGAPASNTRDWLPGKSSSV